MTIAERHVWRRLRALSPAGSHLRRQATIGPYIVDFACHTKRIVIEIDGGQHASDAKAQADRERDADLAAQGYRVLRFWNNDVMENIDGVIAVVTAAFSEAPPHPRPLPAAVRGEGRRPPHCVTHARSSS